MFTLMSRRDSFKCNLLNAFIVCEYRNQRQTNAELSVMGIKMLLGVNKAKPRQCTANFRFHPDNESQIPKPSLALYSGVTCPLESFSTLVHLCKKAPKPKFPAGVDSQIQRHHVRVNKNCLGDALSAGCETSTPSPS